MYRTEVNDTRERTPVNSQLTRATVTGGVQRWIARESALAPLARFFGSFLWFVSLRVQRNERPPQGQVKMPLRGKRGTAQ